MAPNICKIQMKTFLLEVTPKKCVHDLCGRKFIGKSRKRTFWAGVGKIGQKTSHPQKFACSYTYEHI